MGNLHLSKFSVSEPSNQSANALWKFNLWNSWRLRKVKCENRQFIFTTLFNSGQLHYLMSRFGLGRILVSTLIGSIRLLKLLLTLAISLAVISCATVRKQDLDAWVGVPVEALDTHSFFITVPVYRSITSSGIEIRNYANGEDIASCFSNASGSSTGKYVNANAFTTCSSNRIVCNNIFYIRDGIVLEYAPTGRCYTDETVRPQSRYLQLNKK